MGRCICGRPSCEIADGLHRCAKCEQDMIDYHKDLSDRMNKDKNFLDSINYLFSRRVKEFFNDEMKEIRGSGFVLVDKPEGIKQSIYAIDYYVNQWPVGDSTDSFEGYCYLRLANNKYLKWYYEC